jgi:hypothetical protein
MTKLSEATDEQLLKAIEEYGSSGTDTLLTFDFTLGGTEEKPLFYIAVKAGEDNTSDPAEVLDSLLKYQKVAIELYFWQPMPPPEDLKMDDITFDGTNEKGEKVTYKFTFDVRCFPHRAIDVLSYEHFKDQPWAKEFHRGTIGYIAKVDLATVCNIVRYCDKIGRLKMFW